MLTIRNLHHDPMEYAKELSRYLILLKSTHRAEYFQAAQSSIWNGAEAFEPVTGGIYIPDCEWCLCEHPYKNLFLEMTGNSYRRMCPLDEGILLRGPSVYYYLVTHKPKGKPLKKDLVELWKGNIQSFLCDLRNASCTSNLPDSFFCSQDPTIAKFILGILDNIRHVVLHCLTARILMKRQKSYCFCIGEEASSAEAEQLLIEVLDSMETMLFKDRILSVDILLRNLSNRTLLLVNQTFKILLSDVSEKRLECCLKLHREADNFWENYVTMRFVSKEIRRRHPASNSDLRFFCVMSGALELAVLLKYMLQDFKCNIFCIGINGDYIFRHCETEHEGPVLPIHRDPCSYLVDDNVMTGGTIIRAYEIIRENFGICPDKCIFLRHPDINRIPQMVAYGQAISIEFLRQYSLGMLNPSPYSRIAMHSNIEGEYLDCFGVFTKTGEFFLRYLYKNGLFNIDSEVDHYGKNRNYTLEDEHALLL